MDKQVPKRYLSPTSTRLASVSGHASNQVGVEVGVRYLLGRSSTNTYLLETLCTSRFQQFKVGVGYKTKKPCYHDDNRASL